jgi:hypothetical protein
MTDLAETILDGTLPAEPERPLTLMEGLIIMQKDAAQLGAAFERECRATTAPSSPYHSILRRGLSVLHDFANHAAALVAESRQATK